MYGCVYVFIPYINICIYIYIYVYTCTLHIVSADQCRTLLPGLCFGVQPLGRVSWLPSESVFAWVASPIGQGLIFVWLQLFVCQVVINCNCSLLH